MSLAKVTCGRVHHGIEITLGGIEAPDALDAGIDIRLHEGQRRLGIGKPLARGAGDVIPERRHRQARDTAEIDAAQHG